MSTPPEPPPPRQPPPVPPRDTVGSLEARPEPPPVPPRETPPVLREPPPVPPREPPPVLREPPPVLREPPPVLREPPPVLREPPPVPPREPPPAPRRRRTGVAPWILLAALLVGIPLLLLWLAYAASDKLAEAVPARFDAELARPLWAQLEASPERCRTGTAPEYVSALVQPLVSATRGSSFEYRFMVTKDPAVNAFALPGGYVVVNLGLLKAAQSSEEVAAVLAHELSHVELRHGSKRLLRTLGISLVLSWVVGSPDPGVVVSVLRELASKRHDRGEEAAADTQGLELLARAGIAPHGMATFFERLAREPSLPELLSTHPDPGARAARASQASGRTTVQLPALPASWSCE